MRAALPRMSAGAALVLFGALALAPARAGGPLGDYLWSQAGESAGDHYGAALAGLGDIDGDGNTDFVVAAPDQDAPPSSDDDDSASAPWSDVGLWRIHAGDPDNPGLGELQVGLGFTPGEMLGFSVASAGDVNGDGYPDLVYGAPGWWELGGAEVPGAAFVSFGGPELDSDVDWGLHGDSDYSGLGRAVAGAGDVNGDGYGDLVLGAPFWHEGSGPEYEGAVYVMLWDPDDPVIAPDTWDQRFLGSEVGPAVGQAAAWANFGAALAGLGDVDGDGYCDVAVGAPGWSASGSDDGGAVFVLFGSPSGLEDRGWFFPAQSSGNRMGSAVAAAGDVNGDGYADVIIGQPGASFSESPSAGGAVVLPGGPDGPSTIPIGILQNNEPGAFLGTAVAGLGDLDGDGHADVGAGSPGHPGAAGDDAGRVDLEMGAPYGLAGGWEFYGTEGSARLGSALAAAGDVDADGFPDILIGAPTMDQGASERGVVFLRPLFPGDPDGAERWGVTGTPPYPDAVDGGFDFDGDGDSEILAADGGNVRVLADPGGEGSEPETLMYANYPGDVFAVVAAGDVDGDGYDEALVGYDAGGSGTWALHAGGGKKVESKAVWTRSLSGVSPRLGASSGDVDGDGLFDIAIFDEPGSILLFRGSPSGLQTDPSWVVDGGPNLSLRGDLNGDGYHDVVSGNPDDDGGGAEAGIVEIFYGAAELPAAVADWVRQGTEEGARFGSRVSAGGDHDGDGVGDLVVSAPRGDGVAADSGRLFMFRGSVEGVGAGPTWVFEGIPGCSELGRDLDASGDLHADGVSDVLASCLPAEPDVLSPLWIFRGAPEGMGDAVEIPLPGFPGARDVGVAYVGDADGDGTGDLAVHGVDTDGVALLPGKRRAGSAAPFRPRLRMVREPGGGPLAPGAGSPSSSQFVVRMEARGALGRSRVQLEVEARHHGESFGTGPTHWSEGWTDTGIGGTTLELVVGWLEADAAPRFRARLRYDPAMAPIQPWTPWIYGGNGRLGAPHVRSACSGDADGDGFPPCGPNADCNDEVTGVNPGAEEVCDGYDTDCDGVYEEWELDLDGDGALVCEGDCDDSDPRKNQRDNDGDGFSACGDPADCDDEDPERNPGLAERCDDGGADTDCDGSEHPEGDYDDPDCWPSRGCDCEASVAGRPAVAASLVSSLGGLWALLARRRRAPRRSSAAWRALILVAAASLSASAAAGEPLPLDAGAYEARVKEALAAGACADAETLARELSVRAPDLALGWQLLGDAARCRGDARAAVGAYRRYVEAGGADAAVRELLQALSANLAQLDVELVLPDGARSPTVALRAGPETLAPRGEPPALSFPDLVAGAAMTLDVQGIGLDSLRVDVAPLGLGEHRTLRIEPRWVGIGAVAVAPHAEELCRSTLLSSGNELAVAPGGRETVTAGDLTVRVENAYGVVEVPLRVDPGQEIAFDPSRHLPAALTIVDLPAGASIRIFIESPDGTSLERTAQVAAGEGRIDPDSGARIAPPLRIDSLRGGSGGLFVRHPLLGEANAPVVLAAGQVNATTFAWRGLAGVAALSSRYAAWSTGRRAVDARLRQAPALAVVSAVLAGAAAGFFLGTIPADESVSNSKFNAGLDWSSSRDRDMLDSNRRRWEQSVTGSRALMAGGAVSAGASALGFSLSTGTFVGARRAAQRLGEWDPWVPGAAPSGP